MPLSFGEGRKAIREWYCGELRMGSVGSYFGPVLSAEYCHSINPICPGPEQPWQGRMERVESNLTYFLKNYTLLDSQVDIKRMIERLTSINKSIITSIKNE